MSDFKIKVTADLDTSQVEAKLMTLQNRKITIQANANGNGLSNMNNKEYIWIIFAGSRSALL